ncbi:dual specificity protein phosphatase family protein [Piscirickettsia salmonis]|uniref:dual specificity protein phosphatase family protein n=1 Tax=Piscirickettsia salmonis TaxID=1238 RepID=UPI00249E3EA7|nr:dual specificity protein phosphatase [Piscirickettsia salmonis]
MNLPAFGKSSVYLGPESQLKNAIDNKGVKYVINVGNVPYTQPSTDQFKFPDLESAEERTVDGIQFLFCPAKDLPGQDLSQYFSRINQFLRDALKTEQPIFIHCHQGISRSASALSAFLLEKSKDSAEKTIDLLRTHRRCINPNLGFVAQLLTFQKSLPPSLPSEPTVQSQSSMPFADRSAANSEAAEAAAQPPQP